MNKYEFRELFMRASEAASIAAFQKEAREYRDRTERRSERLKQSPGDPFAAMEAPQ